MLYEGLTVLVTQADPSELTAPGGFFIDLRYVGKPGEPSDTITKKASLQ